LSALPFQEGLRFREPLSLPLLPPPFYFIVRYLAQGNKIILAHHLRSTLVLDPKGTGVADRKNLPFNRGGGHRHWFRQFRLHLPEFEPILQGQIQMDEAYFRKLSLLMAKEVGSNKIAHQIIFRNSVNRGEAANFLFQFIQPKSQLHTDGAGIYRGITNWWQVRHRKDIHKKWEFSLTSEIEGMFGNLRTFIRRMYHHVTPEYLPELVAEFSVRFSHPEIFDSPLTFLEKSISSVPLD
jgi:hypothetical protein